MSTESLGRLKNNKLMAVPPFKASDVFSNSIDEKIAVFLADDTLFQVCHGQRQVLWLFVSNLICYMSA